MELNVSHVCLTLYLLLSVSLLSFKEASKKEVCYKTKGKEIGYALKVKGKEFSFMSYSFAMGELYLTVEKGVIEKTRYDSILLDTKKISYFIDFNLTEEVSKLPGNYLNRLIQLEKGKAKLLNQSNTVLKKCSCRKSIFNNFSN